MLLPIKRKIPYIKSWVTFDFEIAILDIKNIYRLRWNWDIDLEKLSLALDSIDNSTFMEVYIDRYYINYNKDSFFRAEGFEHYKQKCSSRVLMDFDYKNKIVEEIMNKLLSKFNHSTFIFLN